VIDWERIKKAYEQVKELRDKGMKTRVDTKDAAVYSMGQNNPVIRIDVKEQG
jgi:hypothetical protein